MISVTILVKNGEPTLFETLSSLKGFEEIIVVDTGSTDRTKEIAKSFPNVKFFEKKFNGFGPSHNEMASLATHEWILSIDADEVLTEKLFVEIENTTLDPECVYFLQRINFFNGKRIRWCGWGKENIGRLYNKKRTAFSENRVHEGVLTHTMKKRVFQHPLLHTPYLTISDFLKKMELYSTLFAEEHRGKKKSSPFIAFAHGSWAFLRSYFIKRGFLGGYEGFLISLYNGHTAFYKYLKLYHLNAPDSR